MYDKNHTGNLFLVICHVILIIISAYAKEQKNDSLLGFPPKIY